MKMPNKSIHLIGLACLQSLFFFVTMATLSFVLSWVFLLGSTGASHIIDNKRLPWSTSSNRAVLVTENAGTAPRRPSGVPTLQPESAHSSTVGGRPPQEQEINICDPKHAVLKFFMFDMPPEFRFGLLEWKPDADSNSVWPNISKKIPSYPGGLNLQHSIEY